MKTKLGISGGLAARFQDNALTPLLAVAAMLLGVFAVIVTPREEEPQIDVTFANVFVGFPGASTTEVENLVALPMEQVLAEIDGVKHVYSVSRPGMGVLTVQFKVGEPRTEALVRLYNAIFSNQDWRPQNLGILPPIVKPKGYRPRHAGTEESCACPGSGDQTRAGYPRCLHHRRLAGDRPRRTGSATRSRLRHDARRPPPGADREQCGFPCGLARLRQFGGPGTGRYLP
jgi:hypothetical protein